MPLPLGVASKAMDQDEGWLGAAVKKWSPNVDGGKVGSGEEANCARDKVVVHEEEAEKKVMEVDDAQAMEEAADTAEQTSEG